MTTGKHAMKKAKGKPTESDETPAAQTVFDQRGQQVGPQANIQRQSGTMYNIHIEHAASLTLGDGARADQDAAPGNTIQSSQWNTQAIRDLLTAALGDEALTNLCFDHFQAVYEQFTSGMSQGRKIQLLLEYCERHDQMRDLIAHIQERNPAQYARFARTWRRA